MAVLTSVTVRAFADRRQLVLDASDGPKYRDEMPMRESDSPGLAPPGRQSCFLRSDEERDVTVELNLHDAPVEVDGSFEHVEFDGGGESFAVRGLFGEPYAVIAASSPRWHVAARYYPEEWFWRLHVWPASL